MLFWLYVLTASQMETLHPSEDEEESAKKPKGSKKTASTPLGEDGVLRPLKLSKGELYKAPTVEELNQLKEAESLFHCSLLKMQVSTAFGCFWWSTCSFIQNLQREYMCAKKSHHRIPFLGLGVLKKINWPFERHSFGPSLKSWLS